MAFGNVVVVDVFLTDLGRYGAYDEVLRAVPDRGGLDAAGLVPRWWSKRFPEARRTLPRPSKSR